MISSFLLRTTHREVKVEMQSLLGPLHQQDTNTNKYNNKMIHKAALLVLLFASGKFAQAQDNTTVAPNVDVNDAQMLFGIPDCAIEYSALEMCDSQHQCSNACEEALQEAADPDEQMSDPLKSIDDPTNTSGISDAIRAGFDAACENAKEKVCNAKGCCPECFDEVVAIVKCHIDLAIPILSDTLSSLGEGFGEAVDAGLGLLNDLLAGSKFNTTIAPTGFAGQGGNDTFTDVIASLKCDVNDIACYDIPTTPGDSVTPGKASAPGSPTAPGPSPVSSATMTCCLSAVVVMAAVGMLLM
jgi:hypothetical protein